jgi:hypothetical protein
LQKGLRRATHDDAVRNDDRKHFTNKQLTNNYKIHPNMTEPQTAPGDALQFVRQNKWLVALLSALVIVPCLWHRHIEAGDLGSHVYNAWLAQLIGNGQAPGLYLAPEWNNILFDVTLLHVANWIGFAVAEKLVVSACVLIFFWSTFAFIAVVTGRSPWLLTPCIAMLAYGYSFNMGFMNYYLSVGLGSLCLALTWPGRSRNWTSAVPIAFLVATAHPIGLLWVAGVLLYVAVRPLLPGPVKLVIPLGIVVACRGFRSYVNHSATAVADFSTVVPFQASGADQLVLYGARYYFLAWAAITFGMVCFVRDLLAQRKQPGYWKRLELPLELCLILFVAAAFAPENIRFSIHSAWIGLLVSRLTAISAIVGLCVMACTQTRKWHLIGWAALALVFFFFLFQDTARLNRLEANAEAQLSALPLGTRVIPTIFAPPDSRIQFIVHIADRACVHRCFIYSNYEPSSNQFRVHVAKGGSWIVDDSPEDVNDMQGGGYEIQQQDLPVKQLYQCDREDWTKLCLRDLAKGESTGDHGFPPDR